MRTYRCAVIAVIASLAVGMAAGRAVAQSPPSDPFFVSITPSGAAVVVGKKPDIAAEFAGPITPGSLLVTLDQTDISQLVSRTETGFRYTSIMVLPVGAHNLRIVVSDASGTRHERTQPFTIRHTQAFEEAYVKNNLSTIYQYAAVKPADATTSTTTPPGTSGATVSPPTVSAIPRSKVEGNLKTDAKVKEQGWDFTLTSNARYFDQDTPATAPLEKGVNVANWLATAGYAQDRFKTKLSLGDVQINETPLTISGLSRKGTVLATEYDMVNLDLFSAWTGQDFGLDGGVGIGDYRDDYLTGAAGGVKLFNKRLEAKAVYVTGSERSHNALTTNTSTLLPQPNTLGTVTTTGHKRGDAVGLLLASDFFQNRLKTDMEVDMSRFDPDITDEFDQRTDYAYRARAFGVLDWYSYEVLHEYYGRDYGIVGNSGLQKDKRGASIRNGFNFGWQAINLQLARYNDNVRGDEMVPRIVNYQITADYALMKFPTVPMGVNYQKVIQDSTREPVGATSVDLQSDTVSGRVNYVVGGFNVGYVPSYSVMNDRTSTGADTWMLMNTLTSAYAAQWYSVASALSWNRSAVHPANVRTDTVTGTLDLRTKFLNDRAWFDTSGSYTIIRATDHSADARTLNFTSALGYNLVDYFKGFVEPAVSLKASYLKNLDRVNASGSKDEFILYLLFTANLPVAF